MTSCRRPPSGVARGKGCHPFERLLRSSPSALLAKLPLNGCPAASVLEVLDTEFVKLARIKRLSERVVIWKHCLGNALISW
jgi:hypothetical protein